MAGRILGTVPSSSGDVPHLGRGVVGDVHGECVRCGERTTERDVAEVADGLVHQSCMKPGEEIA